MRPTNEKPLSETSTLNREVVKGGSGVFLSFEMLKEQLVSISQMANDEFILQVNVHEDGIVLLIGGK